MTVSGVLGVLMKMDSLRGELHLALVSNTHLLVLIIGVPAVIGLGFQYAAMAKKAGKKKKSEGGD